MKYNAFIFPTEYGSSPIIVYNNVIIVRLSIEVKPLLRHNVQLIVTYTRIGKFQHLTIVFKELY
jgi:hypothetical protein